MKRRWPLAAALVGAALVAGVSFAPGGNLLLRQMHESDGFREPEYGAGGVTFYQTRIAAPGLQVSPDFRAALAKTGLKNPAIVEAQFSKVVRTVRKGKASYWLRIMVQTSNPKKLADDYAAQLKPLHRYPGGGSETFDGVCPDGKTKVRFLVDPMGGKTCDFMLMMGQDA